MAISVGADALGLVAKMPSGPGPISDDVIREICEHVPPSVSTFMLTSEIMADAIAAHVERTRPTTVQIVYPIDAAQSRRLYALKLPVKIVQVVHIENISALNSIEQYSPYIDAFLLDSGRPGLATPTLGGTGNTHDWTISGAFVEASPKPVFLAGGLAADNVQAAIKAVRPFGVDICSRVRTDTKLDNIKLKAFMKAVKSL